MKRVLRSCLDPLPRFMSMKSLAILVGMVLLGTWISVHEYLESAQPPPRTPSPSHVSDSSGEVYAAPLEGTAARHAVFSRSSTPTGFHECEIGSRRCSSAGTSDRNPPSPSSAGSSSAPPSVYEPELEPAGG